MTYQGRYPIFDTSLLQTYPVAGRKNKVHWDELVTPATATAAGKASPDIAAMIAPVAAAIIHARKQGWPVILFSGAHLLKNGFGPLIADWMERGIITLYAVNTAGTIHDFELALIGETSEYVPNVLGRGEFGMAYEFAYINEAIKHGYANGLGYGESLGMMITDGEFQRAVLPRVMRAGSPNRFAHPEVSVLDQLAAKKVIVMACPTCMKVAGYKAEDLRPGIIVAEKDKFFNFTKGRIVTLDY